MDFPAIFECDEQGEATGIVHFFCSGQCREHSSIKPDADNHYGESYIPDPDIRCETCGKKRLKVSYFKS